MAKKKKTLSSLFFVVVVYLCAESAAAATKSLGLNVGFAANSDPSAGQFQPLLSDPTGIFSFGFLKTNNSSDYNLAVVHVPSSLPLWTASWTDPEQSSGEVSLSFNGSLVFSDRETGVLWSTSNTTGDRVVLNSSNLQMLKLAEPNPVIWQSFDFPSNTIVQDQNFTSTAALFSTNRRYAMKLGPAYLALFMEFGGAQEAMYWKHTALESKNQIVYGQGPLFAQVDPSGFIGLYQKVNAAVDVIPFDSFSRGISGFRRLTIEDDGNLRGYYWNGTVWVSDYVAITAICDLPSACGAYGLCRAAEPTCGCIDNRSNGCYPPDSGDLCDGDKFTAVTRKGVDLGNKALLGFVKVHSLEECEGLCDRDCSCWGAVYNNGSGYCYSMNYPVQTVEAVGDEKMIGYFKVRNTGNGGGGGGKGRTAEALLISGVVVAVACGAVVIYRLWSMRRRKGADGSMVEGLSPGSYKDLNSSSSRSIELVNSFRK